jgi:hypothetical protein
VRGEGGRTGNKKQEKEQKEKKNRRGKKIPLKFQNILAQTDGRKMPFACLINAFT